MDNTLRVRRAERGRGTTQRAVAKSCRMTGDRYWKIENGEKAPTEKEIAALARYFKCSPSILFPSLAETPALTE
jgi:transcriptional regulator with XRE-family HTH domain